MSRLAMMTDRTHPLVLPGACIIATLSYLGWVSIASSGGNCCWENETHLWGAILVYSIIPGYLIAGVHYLRRSDREALAALQPLATTDLSTSSSLAASPLQMAAGMVAGFVFGTAQFGLAIFQLPTLGSVWLNISMIAANVVLWSTIGWLAAQRLHSALLRRMLGMIVDVDLYDLSKLKPTAKPAVRDVLIIMGALAVMPLQSLDAEFRFDNYQYGLLFGLPAALIFFLVPLQGVHQSIRVAKLARGLELQTQINETEKSDVVRVEALVAHRDRIRALPSWPLDLSLLSRVAFYLVIPPLAWVGAALVENLVQGFIG